MGTSAALLVERCEVEISVDGRKKKQLPNTHDARGLDSAVARTTNLSRVRWPENPERSSFGEDEMWKREEKDCLLTASEGECLISSCPLLSCLLRLRVLHQKRVCLQRKGSYGHPHFRQAQRSRLPRCAACRAVGPPKRHVTVHFTRHGPVAAFPKSRKARVRIDWRSRRQERQTATRTTHIASDPPPKFQLFLPVHHHSKLPPWLHD